MADYVAELCKLALHCQFGPYLMEALTDRLVCGLRSETQQKRFLAEHELTFDRALAIVQSMEAADRDAHTLRGGDTQPGADCLVPQQHPSQRTPVDSSCVKECYCCGSSAHITFHCRFRDTSCYNCQKKGHIAKVCRSRPPTTGRPVAAGNPVGGHRSTKWVQITEGDEDQYEPDPSR